MEDEAATRDTMRRLFEGNGARVRSVESAQAAREAIALKRPSVIISDIGLPGEDGYDFMRSVRSAAGAGHPESIPAIALTAFTRALKAPSGCRLYCYNRLP